MKAHGNGTVQQCAHNLMQIVRGEVPFDRVKGLDPAVIDAPASNGAEASKNDARWVIQTYEPRAGNVSIEVTDEGIESGSFVVTANVTGTQGGGGI